MAAPRPEAVEDLLVVVDTAQEVAEVDLVPAVVVDQLEEAPVDLAVGAAETAIMGLVEAVPVAVEVAIPATTATTINTLATRSTAGTPLMMTRRTRTIGREIQVLPILVTGQ